MIHTFWNKNKDNKIVERWQVGNTFTNHWEAPTYLLPVEDSSLRGGGREFRQALWNAAKSTVEEWTGQNLTQCSLYGIRIYTEGAVLNTHVDRLPLVSSAIINVAQDTDEPWPLELIGHDGKAYNVTMEPGDMVLYESHSVLHGRPFPLKGRFMANLFIHFEPTGHSLKYHGYDPRAELRDNTQQYRKAVEHASGGHETDHHDTSSLPPYLLPGSPEVEYYFAHRRSDRYFKQSPSVGSNNDAASATGSTTAHEYAAMGDVKGLIRLLENKSHLVHARDQNGWTPLHEGARSGHMDIVKALVEMGANINERSFSGLGGTPLYYAKINGIENEAYHFLRSIGAVEIGPEL